MGFLYFSLHLSAGSCIFGMSLVQFSVIRKNGFVCTLVEIFNPWSFVFVLTLTGIGMTGT